MSAKMAEVLDAAREMELIPDQAPDVITLEDLTKWTGKLLPVIDEETGEPTGEKKPGRTLSPSKAAAAIKDHLNLRIDESLKSGLWWYDAGIWKPEAEKEITKTVYPILGDLAYKKGIEETIQHLRSTVGSAKFDIDPYLMPLENGVVDLRIGEFREARPEAHLTFRYNATWDPEKASYSRFLWLLCSSLPCKEDVLTAIDIVVATALRIPLDIIVLLIGGGGNGKGAFERAMLALLTAARATAIELDELKRSRFGPGAVLNKDLWIVSEVEGVKGAMSALKKISTGELLDADQKYAGRVQGIPHAVPILDTNTAFDFGDNTRGRKRRLVKLDFPYNFGDEPGTRPIDRHLEDELKTPEVLAGITQIIAARAPALIRTRKIFLRKSAEEMDDEYKHQRFSLKFFCEDCLSTTADEAIPEKLTTDKAYSEYLDYCKRFNVTEPAEANPFGKYLTEKFGITSTVTTEKKKSIRYYPGLHLVKTAKLAHAENKVNYSNYSTTTGKLQEWLGKTPISNQETTATTGELLSVVLKEIEGMYSFISSCEDPREITWKNYINSPVVAVVSENSKPVDSDFKTTGATTGEVKLQEPPVVDPSEDKEQAERSDSIKAELQAGAQRADLKEAHARELATKYTKKPEKPAALDQSEKIRVAARMEYGYNGSVDPVKVASSLKLPADVVVAWLEANYSRLEKPGGVIRYTQRRATA